LNGKEQKRLKVLNDLGAGMMTMPLAYRFARWLDGRQSEAEENRLLYVAATREREKLIISGHCTVGSRGVKAEGWMKALAEAADLDIEKLVG